MKNTYVTPRLSTTFLPEAFYEQDASIANISASIFVVQIETLYERTLVFAAEGEPGTGALGLANAAAVRALKNTWPMEAEHPFIETESTSKSEKKLFEICNVECLKR